MLSRTTIPSSTPLAGPAGRTHLPFPVSLLPFKGSAKAAAVAFTTELLTGSAPIRSVKSEIADLRSHLGQEEDLTTDIEYFLDSNHPRNRRPVVFLFRDKSQPTAAVFLHEVCFKGVRTGLCRAGDAVGEGILVAPNEQREEFLRFAVDDLVIRRKKFHTVRLRVKTAYATRLIGQAAPGTTRQLVDATVKHKMLLPATYPALLGQFGVSTRGNLAARRRILQESLNPEFLSCLAPEQAFETMSGLRLNSSPVRPVRVLEARREFLRSRAHTFAMALKSQSGTWLSFVSGWRGKETTYLDMQLNHSGYKRECLSAVMRGFLLENEIAIGQKSITFVGGSSALLERYCAPTEAVADLVVSRPTARGWLFKKLVERLQRAGRIGHVL